MNLASNYFFTTVRYELLGALVTLPLKRLALPLYVYIGAILREVGTKNRDRSWISLPVRNGMKDL